MSPGCHASHGVLSRVGSRARAEYDYAIIEDVKNGRWREAEEGISAIKSLLMVTKSDDIGPRIRRCMMTGVARFVLTSLFSGANHFEDMTSSPLTSRALGFTAAEILASFPAYLERMDPTDPGPALRVPAEHDLARPAAALLAASGQAALSASRRQLDALSALQVWYKYV